MAGKVESINKFWLDGFYAGLYIHELQKYKLTLTRVEYLHDLTERGCPPRIIRKTIKRLEELNMIVAAPRRARQPEGGPHAKDRRYH